MQAAGTGGPDSTTGIPVITRGTRIPAARLGHHNFCRDKTRRRGAAQQQPLAEAEEPEVKPDIKPRRLATSYLGPPGLLRMIGSGDEDHIITKVVPGTDPLQDFEDDDPSQTIVIDHDTDASSDVDDLSKVSMASAGGIGKQEFQGLL